jgi:hypothetical protein
MASDARQPRAEDEFAVLTDGVIVLQCLDEDDAEAYLADEDGDQIRWLAGGPASWNDCYRGFVRAENTGSQEARVGTSASAI